MTDSTACQVDKYEIFSRTGSTTTPTGMAIDNTAYLENPIQGTLNAKSPAVTLGVNDGQIPSTYYFAIKATAEGGNIRWIENLSLNTFCPTSVPLYLASSLVIQ